MPQSSTIILLPQTVHTGNEPETVVGEAVPAAAYYLGKQSLQTVSYSNADAEALLVIEATLSTSPDEGDWFEARTQWLDPEAGAGFFNVPGNFVYLRAVLRDFTRGTLNYVKVSY